MKKNNKRAGKFLNVIIIVSMIKFFLLTVFLIFAFCYLIFGEYISGAKQTIIVVLSILYAIFSNYSLVYVLFVIKENKDSIEYLEDELLDEDETQI